MTAAPMGHNTVPSDELKKLVARVEALEAEKQTFVIDIRELYAEAKGKGFDVKAMRALVRLRKMDAAEREERQAMLDLYLSAMGML